MQSHQKYRLFLLNKLVLQEHHFWLVDGTYLLNTPTHFVLDSNMQLYAIPPIHIWIRITEIRLLAPKLSCWLCSVLWCCLMYLDVSRLEVTTFKKTAAERVPSECSQPRYIGDIFQKAVSFQNLYCGDASSAHVD